MDQELKSLKELYAPYQARIVNNERIQKRMLAVKDLPENKIYAHLSDEERVKKVFQKCVEEAEVTLSLLKDVKVDKGAKVLEVGGGIGLVYAFLKKQGYEIYAVEPSQGGFSSYYETAREICREVGVDASHFYPLTAAECNKIGEKFDVIFSNNVLEHIHNLKESLEVLKGCLKEDGVMVMNTVNYLVPYEPHFKMFLVPFFPQLTAVVKPSLRKSELWRGLNFITTRKLKRICKLCNLSIQFDRGAVVQTFQRLDTDEEFAKRQKKFVKVYKMLKRIGMVNMLRYIPVSLTTPIRFKMRQK